MVQFFDTPGVTGAPDFSQMGALSKFGLFLQNIADPTTLPKYQETLKQQQIDNLRIDQVKRQQQRESALAQLASSPQFQGLSTSEKYSALAAIDPSYVNQGLQYAASQEITPYQQAQLGLERSRIAASQAAAAAEREQKLAERQAIISALQGGDLNGISQAAAITGNSALASYANGIRDQKAKVQAASIPGLEIREGYLPTPDDATKAKAAFASYQKLMGPTGLLSRYESAVDKYGSELGGEGAVELDGLRTDIKLELKNIYELGALAGPDEKILDAQIYDPTSAGANVRGLFPIVMTSPATLTKNSIKRLETTIGNTLNAGLGVSGYNPYNLSPQNDPTDAIQAELNRRSKK
jgi:hypothetical protein